MTRKNAKLLARLIRFKGGYAKAIQTPKGWGVETPVPRDMLDQLLDLVEADPEGLEAALDQLERKTNPRRR